MKNNQKKRRFDKSKRRLLGSFLRGCTGLFVLCMLAAILSTLASTLQPQIIRVAVDAIICGNESELPSYMTVLLDALGGITHIAENIWIVALVIIGVALIHVLASYGFRVLEARASGKLVKNIRDSLFSHIQHLPYSWFSQNKTGDLIQRSTTDIDTVKDFLSQQMTSIVRIVLTVALAGYFMFSMDSGLALIALAPMPIFVIVSVLFHNKLADSFEECDENEGLLSAVAQENLSGIRVVRAFGRERSEIEKFGKQNRRFTDLMKKMDRLICIFWSSTDVLAGLQIMSVLLFGARFCIGGSITEGELIAFLTYNTMLLWPIRELGEIISEMAQAGVSLERIFEVMNVSPEADTENAVECPTWGDIEFSHVSFSYEGGSEVLHDVSFSVKAGTTLGILGGAGSGKSTLMLLLDKLYMLKDGEGRITLGGVDLKNIRTKSLRQNIGIVTQEPYLFSGTLKENILMAKDSADGEMLANVVTAAALTETVVKFTDGYETVVGEGGVTLSGGQKQRVAIARALLTDAPIMIFDDSLSAVDTETDNRIRRAISERFGKATVILISHRVSTVSAADHIIVLDGGRISEHGTHDELRCAGGIYRRIYELQNMREEDGNDA